LSNSGAYATISLFSLTKVHSSSSVPLGFLFSSISSNKEAKYFVVSVVAANTNWFSPSSPFVEGTAVTST